MCAFVVMLFAESNHVVAEGHMTGHTFAQYRVAVLDDNMLGVDRARAERTLAILEAAGYEALAVKADDLKQLNEGEARRFELLVLPDSPIFPAPAIDSLDAYVRSGGDLVLLGGRSFQKLLTKRRGAWVEFEALKPRLHSGQSLVPLSAFEDFDIKQWKRSAKNGPAPSSASEASVRRGSALRLDLKGVDHFDSYKAQLKSPIPTGHNVLVVWSRAASKKTRQAVFEFRTRSGARWIATLDLSTSWEPTILRPNDFVYHEGGSGDSKRVLRFDEADRVSFGLARDYAQFDGPDHSLMLTVLGTTQIDLASTTKLERLNLFADWPSFQFDSSQGAISAPALKAWRGEAVRMEGRVTGTAAFTVPKASQSQAYPVLQVANHAGQPTTAAALIAHYGGPFADSQWFVSGIENAEFYRRPEWEQLLVDVVGRMRAGDWLRESQAEDPFADPMKMREILGVTHAGAKYHFTDRGVLNEGAGVLQELGTRTIKLWVPRPQELYRFNHEWPDNPGSMVEVLQTSAWREVLGGPFDTYYLEAFAMPRRMGIMNGGITPDEAQWITQEFADTTRYLLETYRGSGKTFVLQNWEGDWALRGVMDRDVDPTPERIRAMIDWLNARQAGVDQARKAIGEDGVRVLHAAETNLVLQQMQDDRPGVVRDVLPHTRVDLASYSCYDTRGDAKAFRAALEYIAMHLPPTTRTDLANRVVIGEYGVPEMRMGLDAVQRMLPEQVEIATAYGSPHLLYWALYCNELRGNTSLPVKRNDQVNGFWLIKPDGSRAWAWNYLSSLMHSKP